MGNGSSFNSSMQAWTQNTIQLLQHDYHMMGTWGHCQFCVNGHWMLFLRSNSRCLPRSSVSQCCVQWSLCICAYARECLCIDYGRLFAGFKSRFVSDPNQIYLASRSPFAHLWICHPTHSLSSEPTGGMPGCICWSSLVHCISYNYIHCSGPSEAMSTMQRPLAPWTFAARSNGVSTTTS